MGDFRSLPSFKQTEITWRFETLILLINHQVQVIEIVIKTIEILCNKTQGLLDLLGRTRGQLTNSRHFLAENQTQSQLLQLQLYLAQSGGFISQ